MCNTQNPCNEEKKLSKGIHKGKCATYSVRKPGKMYGRKYATCTVFACTRVRARESKSAKDRCKKGDVKGMGREEGREKISGIRFKGIPTLWVFPFTRVVVTEKGMGESRRAINKNPHRELHIPRDAYRCIFVFLMGNVSHAERSFTIFLHIFRKRRYFTSDNSCVWRWYFGRVAVWNRFHFSSIKWNCYTVWRGLTIMQLLHMHS